MILNSPMNKMKHRNCAVYTDPIYFTSKSNTIHVRLFKCRHPILHFNWPHCKTHVLAYLPVVASCLLVLIALGASLILETDENPNSI